MEDELWWKTTFDRIQPLIEEGLIEEDVDRRHPLMEDNILWKTTFDGRQSLRDEDFLKAAEAFLAPN